MGYNKMDREKCDKYNKDDMIEKKECKITQQIILVSLPFEQALLFVKQGNKISRWGWNGKDMYLELHRVDIKGNKMTLPYIYMKTACNNLVPWVASQTDLLANDWCVLKDTLQNG